MHDRLDALAHDLAEHLQELIEAAKPFTCSEVAPMTIEATPLIERLRSVINESQELLDDNNLPD